MKKRRKNTVILVDFLTAEHEDYFFINIINY
jgi:hypothetical protein